MYFQFLAIRQQINLIRSNIDSMKALVNEQKFHYKDKSIHKQFLCIKASLNNDIFTTF